MPSRCTAARQEAGLKQEELAKSVGISQSTLSNIESGKSEPTYLMARTLADHLHTDIDVLFGNPIPHATSSSSPLIQARRAAGLQQQTLAVQLGVSAAYLSRVERGKQAPSVKFALNVSQLLHQTVEALFGSQEETR